MDPRTRDILQFDLLLDHMARRAMSPLGKDHVHALEPSSSVDEIARRTAPMRDLLRLLEHGGQLPLSGLSDVRPQLAKASIAGSVLDPEEWLPIQRFLEVLADICRFRNERGGDFPELAKVLEGIEEHAELRSSLDRVFDPDGSIRDNASRELASIRRRLRDSERALLRTVSRLTGQLHAQGILQENFSTLRNGRHVLPVKAGSRGKLRGVLHGSSASGETYYVEPVEILEANNELDALQEEEHREIHRILRLLTEELRPLAAWLEGNVETAGRADGLQAIARTAVECGWHLPLVVENGALRLFNAHHPLLSLESRGTSVPITMLLDPGDRCLILSGPNAGGKTTAMKTVATLSLLAQCGCPVPAFPDSTLPAFSRVLADIGDQQDLQAGISTFSGHIRRIRELWEQADAHTLVVMDELGTGTDPHEGTALALALLAQFLQRARLTLTTSHLNPVKQWAEDTPGARNASFSLDPKTSAPTFRLRLDLPGASEALEIAAREGLPPEILGHARELVGQRHIEMGEMLRRIEERERKLAATLKEAEARAKSLGEQEEVLRARAELLQGERRTLKAQSAGERERAVADIRERLERLIAELPSEEQLARRREALIRAREEALREQSLAADERRRLAERQHEAGELYEGQKVFVANFNQWGTILELDEDKQRARVQVGSLELATPVSGLLDHDPEERRREQIEKSEEKALTPKQRERRQQKRSKKIKQALREAEAHPATAPSPVFKPSSTKSISRPSSMTLDLHGYRVEEALQELDIYLDRCLLADYPYVKICHGIGTGKLYEAVREYLRTHPAVKSYRYATPEEGGGGVTVVEL